MNLLAEEKQAQPNAVEEETVARMKIEALAVEKKQKRPLIIKQLKKKLRPQKLLMLL